VLTSPNAATLVAQDGVCDRLQKDSPDLPLRASLITLECLSASPVVSWPGPCPRAIGGNRMLDETQGQLARRDVSSYLLRDGTYGPGVCLTGSLALPGYCQYVVIETRPTLASCPGEMRAWMPLPPKTQRFADASYYDDNDSPRQAPLRHPAWVMYSRR
jgi:hypothetical protein